ncbi:hypothetical protein [Paenarthrobacter sp. TA1.8]|uniref:hypothetical protein n=1 Tax=Paenarthrobacter sp. TA1.8 TaxID=3400219 RepID=UPI003B42D649
MLNLILGYLFGLIDGTKRTRPARSGAGSPFVTFLIVVCLLSTLYSGITGAYMSALTTAAVAGATLAFRRRRQRQRR